MELDRSLYRQLICEKIPLNSNIITNTPFISKIKATISIDDYITRILKYAKCSDIAFILSMIYLRRIQNTFGNEVYNKHSFHRLYISSIVVATKFIDDDYCNNKYYAAVGGINVKELNLLEISFLSYIKFDLYVTHDELVDIFNI